MTILAIDPGPEQSAIVEVCDGRVISHEKCDNDTIRGNLVLTDARTVYCLVIEQIASYGMPVGQEVFETCVWTGRFMEAWGGRVDRIPRKQVCVTLCGSARAKDANIRRAIIDRFGGKERAIGKRSNPGPLYGIAGDEWAALAVGLTWLDRNRVEAAAR